MAFSRMIEKNDREDCDLTSPNVSLNFDRKFRGRALKRKRRREKERREEKKRETESFRVSATQNDATSDPRSSYERDERERERQTRQREENLEKRSDEVSGLGHSLFPVARNSGRNKPFRFQFFFPSPFFIPSTSTSFLIDTRRRSSSFFSVAAVAVAVILFLTSSLFLYLFVSFS